ncbi:alpha/beta fold hydrolase [Rhodococcus sp. ACT016]|uniref:alpha/beta fold hydrolase n=1 Tax=Rhodococcus sp. ACT016 TaxID=3134808 RepID=UPI003D2ADC1F
MTITDTRRTFAAHGLQVVGDVVTAAGEAGVAVMLHGAGQTRHSWSRTAPWLGDQGWTTVALDARGHGESDWAPDGDYAIDALVYDLAAVVDDLNSSPVLVGASMGGATALLAVGESRVRAKGLVLVDVVPRVEQAGVSRVRNFMTACPDGFESLEAVADAVAAYNPHRTRPRRLDGLRKNLRIGDDGRWRWHWDPSFLRHGGEPARTHLAERLLAASRRIEVPTLIIRGAQSDVVTPEGVAELLEAIPHAREIVVPGAGHMIAGDDNSIFGASLLDFLAGL